MRLRSRPDRARESGLLFAPWGDGGEGPCAVWPTLGLHPATLEGGWLPLSVALTCLAGGTLVPVSFLGVICTLDFTAWSGCAQLGF